MRDTKNLILLNLTKQFCHLFLKRHGTTEFDLKAKITSWESDSSQRLWKPYWWAISIVVIAATNSANKAFSLLKNGEKHPIHMPSEFLKIPLAEALTGFLVEALSVLTLIQEGKWGDHITSIMEGALGGFNVDFSSFEDTKFLHISSGNNIVDYSMLTLQCFVLFDVVSVTILQWEIMFDDRQEKTELDIYIEIGKVQIDAVSCATLDKDKRFGEKRDELDLFISIRLW